MLSSDTKPALEDEDKQLGCSRLPSEEFGVFPELLSCSMRVLQAALRDPREQTRVLTAGPRAACRRGHLPRIAGQLGCLADLCLCRYVERHGLCLCVCFLSLSRQSAWLVWRLKLCLVPAQGAHGVWTGPAQQRQTGLVKTLLQLALLCSVGVFSAIVAEEAPRCGNLSGTCKRSNPRGSEQENHWKESSEEHSRVSDLSWTASSSVTTANL